MRKTERENEKKCQREWQREGHKSPLCTTVLNYQIKKKSELEITAFQSPMQLVTETSNNHQQNLKVVEGKKKNVHRFSK